MARRNPLSMFNFQPDLLTSLMAQSPFASRSLQNRYSKMLKNSAPEDLGTESNDPYAGSSVVEPDYRVADPNLLVTNDDPTRPGGELYQPPAPENRNRSGLSLGANNPLLEERMRMMEMGENGNYSSIGSRARRSLGEQDEGLLSLLMSNRLFGGRR